MQGSGASKFSFQRFVFPESKTHNRKLNFEAPDPRIFTPRGFIRGSALPSVAIAHEDFGGLAAAANLRLDLDEGLKTDLF